MRTASTLFLRSAAAPPLPKTDPWAVDREVEVVYQFLAGGGLCGRISPRQRDIETLAGEGCAVAGGYFILCDALRAPS